MFSFEIMLVKAKSKLAKVNYASKLAIQNLLLIHFVLTQNQKFKLWNMACSRSLGDGPICQITSRLCHS